jgi:hypothetical protein
MNWPFKQEIEVLPADITLVRDIHDQIIITSKNSVIKHSTIIWAIRETIGIAVVNTRGCIKGQNV